VVDFREVSIGGKKLKLALGTQSRFFQWKFEFHAAESVVAVSNELARKITRNLHGNTPK
jgi:hypothetical protein